MTDVRLEPSPSTTADGTVSVVPEVPGIIIAGNPFPILEEHA